MLDHEDLKWLATSSTDLNRLLQQISRAVELTRKQGGENKSLDLVEERVGQASRLAQALFDRVTSRILSSTGGAKEAPAASKVEAPAAPSRADVAVKVPAGEIATSNGAGGEPTIRNPEGKREMILLVDDDLELLEVTGDMLDFEDYRIVTAKDGFEALEIYRRMGKKIDLIILDYFLPVMDGDAVFDELKALDPGVRVVLSSGFGEQAKLGNMLARGLRGFIPKPYTHEKLMEQVRLILEA